MFFCNEQNVHLYKRDSKKLDACASKGKRISSANKALLYYSIKYACVHGGRKFIKKRNIKNERLTKTIKAGCEFSLHFILSEDGNFLVLNNFNLSHNHIVNEAIYKMHPKERHLPSNVEEKAGKLLNLRANKKLLQAELIKETGKTILLKDLSNIAAKYKKSPESFDDLITKLKSEYKCYVNVLHDNSVLEGLFFQDEKMMQAFDSFPEILFFDGTYKLLDIRFTCYVFIIEDGNGNTEVAGIGLLAREDDPSINWLIDSFKNKNKAWEKTRVIMTDKDFLERRVLKDKFTSAKMLLCKFHVLRTFKREITSEKMKISSEEVTKCKELLTKLCHVSSETEYFNMYQLLESNVPQTVMNYYNKNWHNIYKEWTAISCMSGAFLNFTNNRVESFNAKLKSVIKCYSSLTDFIEKFFILITSLRSERDKNINDAILKVPTFHFSTADPLIEFSEELMPHPLKFIEKQVDAARKLQLQETTPCNYSYELKGILYNVNMNSCSCISFNSMRLPCRHILAVRMKMGVDLFDLDLIDKRWLKRFTMERQRLFITKKNSPTDVSVEQKEKTIPKTRNEKYKMASILAKEIAEIVSETSANEFNRNMGVLREILSCLKNKTDIHISSVSNTDSNDAGAQHLRTTNEPVPSSSDEHNYSVCKVLNTNPDNVDLSDAGTLSADEGNVFSDNEINIPDEYFSSNSESCILGTLTPSSTSDESSLKNISLPRAVIKRGRSKGFDKTVIGLARKKRAKKN